MITVRQNNTIQKKTRNKRRSIIKIKHSIIPAVEAIYCIRQCKLSNRIGNKTEGLGLARPIWMYQFPRVDESLVCTLVDVS